MYTQLKNGIAVASEDVPGAGCCVSGEILRMCMQTLILYLFRIILSCSIRWDCSSATYYDIHVGDFQLLSELAHGMSRDASAACLIFSTVWHLKAR